MKNNIKFLIAAFFVICVGFTNCKKTEESPKTNCRITSITAGSSTIYLTYNSEMKLVSVSSDNYLTTYTYNGNTVMINETHSGVFERKIIVTLNANGLASNIRMEMNETGTKWENYAYQYSGNEVIKQTGTSSDNQGEEHFADFTWSDGNLMEVKSDNSTTAFTYFADKPVQEGDFLQFYSIQIQEGLSYIVKNKNMMKSMVSTDSTSSDAMNFNYAFDADGKITSLTLTHVSGVRIFNYQYQCN